MYNITKYITHDNGFSPFIVKIYKIKDDYWNEIKKTIESINLSDDIISLLCTFISYDKIEIYVNKNDVSDDEDYDSEDDDEIIEELFITIDSPHEVFVGKSYPNYLSMEFGEEYDGNAMLIKPTKDLEYIFIGIKILTFKTDEPITHFISNIGNNDVPYTYAISKSKIYLLTEDKIIETKEIGHELIESFKDASEEPYMYWYGHETIETFPKNSIISTVLETKILHKRNW